MAPSGRSVASAAILGLAALLFVPAFSDAAALGFGGYRFGGELETLLEYAPLLLATAGLAVLIAPLLR